MDIVVALIVFAFSSIILFWILRPKSKLKQQLLKETKNMQQLMIKVARLQSELTVTEAKLLEAKDKCVDLVHKFRRERTRSRQK